EIPLTEEAYLHRSGRTGRMGKDGTVITFVQDHTVKELKKLTRHMAIDMEEIFLHGGQLVKELPQKEEVNDKNTKKTAPFGPSKKEQVEKNSTPKKKLKNKQKKQKNKGARRK